MNRPISLLRIFGPGDRPLSPAEVRSRLEPFAALEPEGPPVAGALWSQVWRSPEGDRTSLRLAPRVPGAIDGAFLTPGVPREVRERAARCRWALDCAVELDARHPLAAFGRQLRTCAWAYPQAVAVQDVPAQHVILPDHLRTVASWVAAPPATELYRIHAVHPCHGDGDWWVHTHGLQRIGLPDFELLRVPEDLVPNAAELVRTFVRSHAWAGIRTRGVCDHLTRGERLEWIPARDAVATLGPHELGGPPDRRGSGSHRGRRAAFVEPGRPRSRWRPPLRLLREWDRRDVVFGLPDEEVARASALARERWGLFARLFAEHGARAGWRFHASVACPTPGGREHLWWNVREVEPHRILGRLESSPAAALLLSPGDEAWHDLSRVSDWHVDTPGGVVRPDTVEPSG